MKRYPVRGKGDMEDRRDIPYIPGVGPVGANMDQLARWIFMMLNGKEPHVQSFPRDSELGQLQEAFGVPYPWETYFQDRLP